MAWGISASGPLWAAQPVNDRKQQAASIRIHALFRATVAPLGANCRCVPRSLTIINGDGAAVNCTP